MEKKVEISMLLQIYGELLTKKQYKVIDYYYNEDLSLSEIAENEEITRQGVRDIIKKGEKKLFEYEEKLLFMKKTINQEKLVQHILVNLNKIQKDSSDEKVSNILEEVKKEESKDKIVTFLEDNKIYVIIIAIATMTAIITGVILIVDKKTKKIQ